MSANRNIRNCRGHDFHIICSKIIKWVHDDNFWITKNKTNESRAAASPHLYPEPQEAGAEPASDYILDNLAIWIYLGPSDAYLEQSLNGCPPEKCSHS